jgi:hypothetical protein
LEIKCGWKGVKNGKFETKEFATFANMEETGRTMENMNRTNGTSC